MELEYVTIKTAGGLMYGGDQKLFGADVRKSGCGMIAACDMILFLSGEKQQSFAEYGKFVEDIRDKEAYKKTTNPLGLSPFKTARLINRHSPNNHFAFFSNVFFSEKRLADFIERSIAAGLPVILRIGANGKKLPYNIVYPASGGRMASGYMTWHYITVTGISRDTLTFSSWGGKGEMSVKDLHRFRGFTGGFIIDKKYIENFNRNKTQSH